MSKRDKRNKQDNTQQLDDIFIGGFDQEFDDEIFIDDVGLADELFVDGGHLDQTFLAETDLDLGSHYQRELEEVRGGKSSGQRDTPDDRSIDSDIDLDIDSDIDLDIDLESESDIESEITSAVESNIELTAPEEPTAINQIEDDDLVVELGSVAGLGSVTELQDFDNANDKTTLTTDFVIDLEADIGDDGATTSRHQDSPRRSRRRSKPASNRTRTSTSRRKTKASTSDTAVVVVAPRKSAQRVPPSTPRALMILWVLLVIVPFLASGMTYSRVSAQPDVWKVRAEVQYRGTAWTETQDVAIQSRSLVAPVAEQFNIPIVEFEDNLDAGLVTGTQVLRIEYTSTDGEQAEQVVTALAASYITRTSELTPDGVFETLEAQRAEIETELQLAKQRQSEIPPGISSQLEAERAAAAAEINTLEQRLRTVEAKTLDVSLDNLDLNANRVPILLTEPFRFSEPVQPKPELWAGAMLVVAALASAGIAVIIVGYRSRKGTSRLGIAT